MIGSIRAELLDPAQARRDLDPARRSGRCSRIFFAYVDPLRARSPRTRPSGSRRSCPQALAGNLSTGFPFFGGVFALMLGVFALGSEYGWGTLKTLFTQGPSRLRVFAAKLAALGARAGAVRARGLRRRADRQLRHRADRGRGGRPAVGCGCCCARSPPAG